MSLLPRFVEREPNEPRVLDVTGDDAGEAFDALSSETARRILATVYQKPSTPKDVHEKVGTSLQNVHYHLDRLESAGLIQEAGVGYSEKGNEMTIYAPESEAVVLFAGEDHQRSRLQDVLGRVLGLYILLSVASIAVALFTRERGGVTTFTTRAGDGAAGGAMESESVDAAGGAVEAAASIDPALAFFLGGCVVIAGLGLWWYASGVRR